MNKILLVLFVAIGTFTAKAQEIKWMTVDEALAAQKKKAKPIFMDVYTDWCGPCKMLDKVTFHDKAVADYINENYYAVKFNAEGNSEVNFRGRKFTNPGFVADRKGRNSMHEFTTFLKVKGYPTMMIIDGKGNMKEPIVGNHNPEQLLEALKVRK